MCSAVLLDLAGCGSRFVKPNVVVVVIDTVRADHLSAYGYKRQTTPWIAEFARQTVRFTRAYSVSSWTLPAHASLFTGLYPSTHGATQEHLRLDAGFPTLAEVLRDDGYTTAAFSGNPWVASATGLARGFESMEEMWRRPETREDGARPHATNRLIFEWLERRSKDRPFFLFVNYIEPHFPYEAPALYLYHYLPAEFTAEDVNQAKVIWPDWYVHPRPFAPRAAAIRTALYDAELRYVDAIVDELFDQLKLKGLYDDALIVLVSDHGENLGENGHLDHVFSLYNSTVQVPFMMRLPGGRSAGVRNDPVQLIDVFPTIAGAVRIGTRDRRLPGLNLLDGAAASDRPIVAEYHYPYQSLSPFNSKDRVSPALAPYRRRVRSIQVGPAKFIWGSDGRNELYDLLEDPAERNNLVAARPEAAAELEKRLTQLIGTATQPRANAPEPGRP